MATDVPRAWRMTMSVTWLATNRAALLRASRRWIWLPIDVRLTWPALLPALPSAPRITSPPVPVAMVPAPVMAPVARNSTWPVMLATTESGALTAMKPSVAMTSRVVPARVCSPMPPLTTVTSVPRIVEVSIVVSPNCSRVGAAASRRFTVPVSRRSTPPEFASISMARDGLRGPTSMAARPLAVMMPLPLVEEMSISSPRSTMRWPGTPVSVPMMLMALPELVVPTRARSPVLTLSVSPLATVMERAVSASDPALIVLPLVLKAPVVVKASAPVTLALTEPTTLASFRVALAALVTLAPPMVSVVAVMMAPAFCAMLPLVSSDTLFAPEPLAVIVPVSVMAVLAPPPRMTMSLPAVTPTARAAASERIVTTPLARALPMAAKLLPAWLRVMVLADVMPPFVPVTVSAAPVIVPPLCVTVPLLCSVTVPAPPAMVLPRVWVMLVAVIVTPLPARVPASEALPELVSVSSPVALALVTARLGAPVWMVMAPVARASAIRPMAFDARSRVTSSERIPGVMPPNVSAVVVRLPPD